MKNLRALCGLRGLFRRVSDFRRTGRKAFCRVSRAMTHARIALGKTGEDLACRELTRRGYAILARRYRRRRGEIDIIARDGPTIVFVEVKARESHEFG